MTAETTSPAADHDALVEDAARTYREQGFTVTREPSGRRFGWSTAFTPDFVAHRGDEHVAVEVTSRRALAARPEIIDFSREIDGRPGWRFDLVLTADEDGAEATAVPDERERIEDRLSQIERLGQERMWDAAVLLAASALEAALRHNAMRRGAKAWRRGAPNVLGAAASLGDLEEDELPALDAAWRIRDDVAHGFQAATSPDTAGVADAARLLATTARRVLDAEAV